MKHLEENILIKEFHGTEYGGWTIAPEYINPKSIVYSFGIGEDISFDLSVINKYGVNIFAFDPTPKSLNWLKQQNLPHNFRYYDYGLADFDGYVKFYPPENPEHVSHTLLYRNATSNNYIEVPVKSLTTIMAEFAHTKIDILKMDIEGAEYAIIDYIIKNKIKIKQILVEFHDRFEGIENNKSKYSIEKLIDFGYEVFSVSPSGNEYSLIKKENENSISVVPTILITYNRPWHTAQVLNALKRHNIQNLYIYSDAPKSDKDVEGVIETRRLIQSIDWTIPNVVYQKQNQGLAKSIVSAANKVFETYDKLILLEDDCVPQDYFFDFMYDCLNKYENNQRVFGISGYTVNIDDIILKNYHYDVYFFPRMGSWGWATWKNRWEKRIENLNYLKTEILQRKIDLNQGGNDVPVMLEQILTGKLKDVWSLHWLLTVYLNQGMYIYPTKSHIQNIGMDGSGVHCGKTSKYETTIASSAKSNLPKSIIISEKIKDNFLKYYNIHAEEIKVRKLKVVHVCMQDFGGAGNAAFRLHLGLLEIGVDSKMLVFSKKSGEPNVMVIPDNVEENPSECIDVSTYTSNILSDLFARWGSLEFLYPNRPKGLELFSDTICDIDLFKLNDVRSADIINLHWVAGMIMYDRFSELCKLKNVVWTLHDMNAFTGGCHYNNDCSKYLTQCNSCPQLGSDKFRDLSYINWITKESAYNDSSFQVITPSQWLANAAAESKLFSNKDIKVIPYGLPLDIFKPNQKNIIYERYNIPQSKKLVLFVADFVDNKRKGIDYLIGALKSKLLSNESNDIMFGIVGSNSENLTLNLNQPYVDFGRITSEEEMAIIYSAADVFVIPSLEDNLPNTVLESLACGTPVVGFNIGGIPDMIEHKINGYLCDDISSDSLANGILWVLVNSSVEMRKKCREIAIAKYDLKIQANNYLEVYKLQSKDSSNIKRDIFGLGSPNLLTQTKSNLSKGPKVIIATSISPKGIEKQKYAINSWLEHGFEVISLNSPREIPELLEHFDSVKFYSSTRDAEQICGKPLVYINDIIQMLLSHGTKKDIFGIVNSDIIFRTDSDIKELIRIETQDNSLIYGHRLDVESIQDDGGEFYLAGFDYFFFNYDVANNYAKTDFAIGLPWWDYYAIIWPIINGFSIKTITEGFAVHIKHPSFYEDNHWVYYGDHLFDIVNEYYKSIGQEPIEKYISFVRNGITYDYKYIKSNIAQQNHLFRHLTYLISLFGKKVLETIDKNETRINLSSSEKVSHKYDLSIQTNQHLEKLKSIDNDYYKDTGLVLNNNQLYPKISIVTPSYNQAEYLEQTILSVLNQNYPNLEYIIIDGGSTDGSVEVIKKYENKLAYWISEKDNGQSDALNKGFRLVTGEIIGWINSDDWYEENTFEKVINYLVSNPNKNVLMGDCNLVDENGIIFDKVVNYERGFDELKQHWVPRSIPTQPAIFFRKKLLDKYGLLDETLHYAMDYDLWMRFAMHNRFYHIDQTFANYRFHTSSKGGDQNWEKFVPDCKIVYNRYCNPLVSVIIPCYNYAHYLKKGVESVIRQTYQNFEIIIVNDGSTDNTLNVANSLKREFYNYDITIIDQENSGHPAISRNNGIKVANGKYILPLDADDMIDTTMIEKCVSLLENNKSISIAYTDQVYFNESGRKLVPTIEYDFQYLIKNNFIGSCSLFRKSTWDQVGGYDESIAGYEDWEFWISCGKLGNIGKRIPENLFYYRVSNEGVYNKDKQKHQLIVSQIIIKHKELFTNNEVEQANLVVKDAERVNIHLCRFKIIAIISAYNEADIINHVIGDLIKNGIDVYLLDNSSTDDTVEQAKKWLNKGLLHIESFPQDCGYPTRNEKEYVWRDILKRKEELAYILDADWFIHADADEFRASVFSNTTLAEGIKKVDELGYNAINFELFNFRPTENNFVPYEDVRNYLTKYEPGSWFDSNQIKAWKKPKQKVDLVTNGGHIVVFEGLNVFPINFILMHYPIRSEIHGRRKILTERLNRYSREELKMGWHCQYNDFVLSSKQMLWSSNKLEEFDIENIRQSLFKRYQVREKIYKSDIANSFIELERNVITYNKNIDILISLAAIYYKFQDYYSCKALLFRILEIDPQHEEASSLLKSLQNYGGNSQQLSEKCLASIIVPVFNKSDLTKNCIESIYKHTDLNSFELIIVDNGSTDDTQFVVDEFKKKYSNITYLKNSENLGYAKANNIGAKISNSDYLLLLNNDTAVINNWLSPMLELIVKDKSIAAVGAKLLFSDNTIQHAGVAIIDHKKFNDPILAKHLFYKFDRDNDHVNKAMEYQAVTGACMLLNKQYFFEVGGLDESYWNGYEDVDLCFRLREKGYKIIYQPKSEVYHFEEKSGKERFSNMQYNFEVFHKKWLGKILPDYTVDLDGKIYLNEPNGIKEYNSNAIIENKLYFVNSQQLLTASIIILTYNSAATIERCMNSVRENFRAGDEVIVVDNNSRDNTVEIVRSLVGNDRRFTIIQNNENIGFSAGTNVGIRLSKNPIVVMLNPDTVVNEYWLDNLISKFEDKSITAVGPVSNRVAGNQRMEIYPKDDLTGWTLPDVAEYFNKNFKSKTADTKLLIGFCIAVRRDFIEKYGGLDEDLFLGNDDLELSWRIRTNSGKLVVALDAFVYHVGQASFQTENKSHTDRLVQESTDALYRKLEKHYGKGNVPSSVELWGMNWFQPSNKVLSSDTNDQTSFIMENDYGLTSIIILAKDQYEYTKECIDSIFKFTKSPFELILVDNGSRDEIPNYFHNLQKNQSNVTVITNQSNVGFPKGVNQALRKAKGKYVLIGNNDTVVTPGWLEKMIEHLEKDPKNGLVGPISNNISGLQIDKEASYQTMDEMLRYAQNITQKNRAVIQEFPRLAFFCTLIKREVFDKIGGLDERFSPGNYEDDDFCMRAQVAGYKAHILRYIFIHHYRSRSFAGDGNDAYRERLQTNRKKFAEKWGGTPDEIWLEGKLITPPELYIPL